jgi:hypothetical protein
MRRDLPEDLASFRSATHFSILQLWYGNPSLHYETWIRSRLEVIEIGLHFESDPLTNARLLAAFRARERAVRKALGDGARIETWDKGWARVWESLPLAPLDGELIARIAARLIAYVMALESVLREELPAEVEWSEPKDGRYAPRRLTAGRRPAEREVR